MRLYAHPRVVKYSALLRPDRLGGQTVGAFALKILNAGASFVLSLVVARLFGASGSGHFGLAVTTVTLVSGVVLCGLDYSLIRTAAGDLREGNPAAARGVIRRSAQIVLIIAPLVAVAMWCVRIPLSGRLLGQEAVTPLLAIMVWAIVPITVQRIASSALRVSGRVVTSQLFDGPASTTLAMIVLVGLVASHRVNSLPIVGFLYTGAIFITAGTAWRLYFRTARQWPPATQADWRPLLVMGLPIVALNLSNAFTEWYTTVSLAKAWPAATVGQYRAAWQFVALAGLVQTAMDAMIGPRIAAAARVGAKGEIAILARKSILLVLLLGAPLFLALILFPAFWLGIFGSSFKAGATALQILAVGQLVRLASGPIGTILVMTGNHRWQLGYAAAGMICCLVLVAFLVPTYGAVGAAIATGATVVLRNLAAGVIVHRVLRINLFKRSG